MNIPKLRKEKTVKTYHGHNLADEYGYVDQPDILSVLKDPKKLIPEVKKYIEENNQITESYFKGSKEVKVGSCSDSIMTTFSFHPQTHLSLFD